MSNKALSKLELMKILFQKKVDNDKLENKTWRETHKEHINEYHTEWRKNNPDKCKQYYDNKCKYIKTKFNCQCGGAYTHANRMIHFKTKIHQDFISCNINAEKIAETKEVVDV